MIVKKVLLVASAAALMSTPAWALPGHAPSNHGAKHAPTTTPAGPPSTTPNNTDNPGSANRNSHANKGAGNGKGDTGNQGANPGDQGKGNGKGSHPGQSHKCMTHKVGYVVSGTLAEEQPTKLTKNPDGTYSGTLEVLVTHTNHHVAGGTGKTVTEKIENAHVTLGVADTDGDGVVELDDLKKGDQVKLIGKITALSKKCSQTGAGTITIRKIVFHPPAV
jgi:hypothetical protein